MTLTPESRYSVPVGLASPFGMTAEKRLPFESLGVCEAVCGSGVRKYALCMLEQDSRPFALLVSWP